MLDDELRKKITERKTTWEQDCLKPAVERFGLEDSPSEVYTPLDLPEHDYLAEAGFPGEYPFTRGAYPARTLVRGAREGKRSSPLPVPIYSGYGAPEDTRDHYKMLASHGAVGANVAFDLPTQCGYDSDDPMATGEVGKVGVSVDTIRDLEVVWEAFDGVTTMDKMRANFTINAPCVVIMSMYFVMAQKKGIPLDQLNPGGTPQNDILKEYLARGTYIFPPKPSMRLTKDFIEFCTKHVRRMNSISICGYHIREAGATPAQGLAFLMSNAIAYVQLGIDAGLDVDDLVRRFTFLGRSGSMDFYTEIAQARAKRRMWAKIMKERFKATNPRSWLYRGTHCGGIGNYNLTVQRPLNNIIRAVIGEIGEVLACTDNACGGTPYDEAMGLGHSLEARQISRDLSRILNYESTITSVIDPFAGSYFMESLTDKIEAEAWEIMQKIEDMGGAVTAIEKGWTQHEIARSAQKFMREMETGERVIVGVNRFVGENELEVQTSRMVDHPYEPAKRERAEELQLANLKKIRKERNSTLVKQALKEVRRVAESDQNIVPSVMEAVKVSATLGEICNVFRDVFGEFREPMAL